MPNSYVKYLVKAYEIEENGKKVTPKSLAGELGVSRPTAFEYLQKFVNSGWIKKVNKAYKLTEKGRKEAMRVLRNHRIIETLLYRNGVELEEACECAYRIQGLMEDDVVEKIFVSIGCPKMCPHGRVIPDVGAGH